MSRKELDLSRGFKLDMTMKELQRIAAFLNFLAEKHPYEYAPYNVLVKGIRGYAHTPRLKTEEVEHCRRRCSGGLNKILRETYNRETVRRKGVGIRASVDSLDAVKHVQTGRVRRLQSATQSLAATDEIIDTKTIPNTPEARPYKQWYERNVKGILKQMGNPDYLNKLLPPKPEDTEPEGTVL